RTVILALVLAVPALGWAALDLAPIAAPGSGPPALPEFSPTDGKLPAPDTGFTDLAGRPASLADFRGRVVLVNLWATWCQPCVRRMPAPDRLQAAMGGKDFEIVLVSQDRGGANTVEPFFAKLGLNALKSYLDPKGRLGQAFSVRGLPTSILVDRDGNELGRVEGALDWDGPKAQAFLRWQLERSAPKPAEPVTKAAALAP